jgi:hypothetical protein
LLLFRFLTSLPLSKQFFTNSITNLCKDSSIHFILAIATGDPVFILLLLLCLSSLSDQLLKLLLPLPMRFRGRGRGGGGRLLKEILCEKWSTAFALTAENDVTHGSE